MGELVKEGKVKYIGLSEVRMTAVLYVIYEGISGDVTQGTQGPPHFCLTGRIQSLVERYREQWHSTNL